MVIKKVSTLQDGKKVCQVFNFWGQNSIEIQSKSIFKKILIYVFLLKKTIR